MSEITHYMTHDHTLCDDLFAEAENAVVRADWQRGISAFQAFAAATLRHFNCEESLLFPAFETATGISHGPTAVMRSEHEEIRETMQAMQQSLDQHDSEGYLGLAETLLMLMRQHNMKEEQILYPMADQALANTAQELVHQMEMLPA